MSGVSLSLSARPFDELVQPPYLRPIVGDASSETHGTTVLCLRYKGGVLTFSDRRATVGNLIMFDHADKVMALDDATVVAISGSFARAVDACRFLKHSFNYYRRAALQELSYEGKLAEISKAVGQNAQMAAQGVGIFIPIVAAYDKERDSFGVYFFDGAGAQFENGAYACAGSGSERIRGVFEYMTRIEGPFEEKPMEKVLLDGLHMLDIAAQLDSATGGFQSVLPIVRVLDAEGTRPITQELLESTVKQVLKK